ncbi:MAG: DUF4402 domain-containing protein [Pacificimonas sp.]
MRILLISLFLFASATSAPASAASVDEVLRLDVIAPFTVAKASDLQFGQLTVTGKGRVDIDPVTKTRTTYGGVTPAGGSYGVASFTTRGDPGGRVRIRLPERKIDLIREGGGETMTLRRLRTNLNAGRQRLDADGYLTFHVGGTVDLKSGAANGRYEGSFNVEVSYE